MISKEQKAEALSTWIHENIFVVKAPVIDHDPYNDMVRGIAWCDQQANVLITLARKVDIPGQLLFLRGYDSTSHHSVSALFIKGKYRIFDPMFGFLFKNRETLEIATFQKLQDEFNSYISPQYERLKVTGYQSLYEKKYPPRVFRVNTQKGLRKTLALTMDCYYRIFGKPFSRIYINAFLSTLSEKFISNRGINNLDFYKARTHHLLGHYAKAFSIYEKIISKEPKTDKNELDNVCFFKGVSYFDLRRWNECIRYFEEYLEQNKSTKWKGEIAYYIGRSYEDLNRKDKAIQYYKQCEQEKDTPASGRLFHLEGGQSGK